MESILKLRVGTKIPLEDGRNAVIIQCLGSGRQGEVYRVSVDGKEMAIKFFLGKPSHGFVENLRHNIAKGSPSECFTWPLAMTKTIQGTFGYLMSLIPLHYPSFIDLLNGNAHFDSLRIQLIWCINIVNAFKKLHAIGCAIKDINDGGFAFNPHTGKAIICDTDNITSINFDTLIRGKPAYMAPEIIMGTNDPDTYSDRFSLAIILFTVLTLAHPFKGAVLTQYPCLTEKVQKEIYGVHPVYVFNEKDTSNHLIRGYHVTPLNRWLAIPPYIKEEFHKTFTDGLIDRENGRTTELVWLKVLMDYLDEIITCRCGYQYCYSQGVCLRCHQVPNERLILSVNGNNIVLDLGAHLYESHLSPSSGNYTKPVGEIIASKSDASLWGMRNLSEQEWIVQDGDSGDEMKVPPGEVAPIYQGFSIKFMEGTIGAIR